MRKPILSNWLITANRIKLNATIGVLVMTIIGTTFAELCRLTLNIPAVQYLVSTCIEKVFKTSKLTVAKVCSKINLYM